MGFTRRARGKARDALRGVTRVNARSENAP